jgi:nitronate monooxygenase
MSFTIPRIIQGGMGINVSSWRLAKAVSLKGQLGVVSGTAIDAVISRILQLGDKDGHVRRALDHFPFSDMANRVRDRFFVPGGKDERRPFKGIGMPSLTMNRAKTELLIVSNFVEVFLAKEDHSGSVGINYMEKIQIPTLPSLFGAMLAGVNVVLMGAGIPTAIPGILDDLAVYKPVSIRIHVEDNPAGEAYFNVFDPNDYVEHSFPDLIRPDFYGIVSTDIVVRQMERKASGVVNGYVIENYMAGGHNAPPRRDRTQPEGAAPCYTEKDNPDLGKIRDLGKPFWLAGMFTSPEKLKEALAAGAHGIQVGTPFAYCNESAMLRPIKDEVIRQSLAGTLEIETSFTASPTGYPFKMVRLQGEQFTVENVNKRKRVCDMGYLRTAYVNPAGAVAWRCPAEPVQDFVDKGGTEEGAKGRMCLCNGLTATVGYGQPRKDSIEQPILTSGDEVLNLHRFVKGDSLQYSAADVIDYILG